MSYTPYANLLVGFRYCGRDEIEEAPCHKYQHGKFCSICGGAFETKYTDKARAIGIVDDESHDARFDDSEVGPFDINDAVYWGLNVACVSCEDGALSVDWHEVKDALATVAAAAVDTGLEGWPIRLLLVVSD